MELNYKKIGETSKKLSDEIRKLEYVIGDTNVVENIKTCKNYLINLIYSKELQEYL